MVVEVLGLEDVPLLGGKFPKKRMWFLSDCARTALQKALKKHDEIILFLFKRVFVRDKEHWVGRQIFPKTAFAQNSLFRKCAQKSSDEPPFCWKLSQCRFEWLLTVNKHLRNIHFAPERHGIGCERTNAVDKCLVVFRLKQAWSMCVGTIHIAVLKKVGYLIVEYKIAKTVYTSFP